MEALNNNRESCAALCTDCPFAKDLPRVTEHEPYLLKNYMVNWTNKWADLGLMVNSSKNPTRLNSVPPVRYINQGVLRDTQNLRTDMYTEAYMNVYKCQGPNKSFISFIPLLGRTSCGAFPNIVNGQPIGGELRWDQYRAQSHVAPYKIEQ